MLQVESQPYAEERVKDSYATKELPKHCFQTGNQQTNVVLTVMPRGTPLRKKKKIGKLSYGRFHSQIFFWIQV